MVRPTTAPQAQAIPCLCFVHVRHETLPSLQWKKRFDTGRTFVKENAVSECIDEILKLAADFVLVPQRDGARCNYCYRIGFLSHINGHSSCTDCVEEGVEVATCDTCVRFATFNTFKYHIPGAGVARNGCMDFLLRE